MTDIDVGSPPNTPSGWVDWLHSKLLRRRTYLKFCSDYYDGKHQKMVFAQAKYQSEFGRVFEQWSDNFCGLIVDSVNERMFIDGFQMTDEPGGDKDAREIWQRNHLDAESNAAHLDAMVRGVSYAIVWADSAGEPTISIESAENVVVQHKPGSRWDIEAAAKFYTDDWGREFVTLWWNGSVYTGSGMTGQWGDYKEARNPLGGPPVVPIPNRSRLTGPYLSDLAVVIPIQDAVNKTVADALVASEYAAWPQRYVTGLEIQEDEQGRPVEPYKVAVDKLLQAESPDVKFGQFEAADLKNYVNLTNMLVQHMASISRIPFHYFLLNGGTAPSGESITSAEAGLIAKTRERMLHFGEAWERVMRLAFRVMGDKRAEAHGAEVIWRDPENRTEGQHMDALLKRQLLGAPRDQLLLDAGYTPQQIERFRAMREQDAKDAMELAKKYPAPQPEPPNGPQAAEKAARKPPQGNSGNAARKAA
ncbi:phage portal protein [Streptomyces huasconensis]|uniref:Phage portal protein n=1 Tax=Streptomyces huasconensis TaxID=1854574 RepID=A0ABV3M7H5_9ACTN